MDRKPVGTALRGQTEVECQRAAQRVLEAAEFLKHAEIAQRRPSQEVACQRAMRRVLEAAELLKHAATTTFLAERALPPDSLVTKRH